MDWTTLFSEQRLGRTDSEASMLVLHFKGIMIELSFQVPFVVCRIKRKCFR